jgi:hypothetical protein
MKVAAMAAAICAAIAAAALYIAVAAILTREVIRDHRSAARAFPGTKLSKADICKLVFYVVFWPLIFIDDNKPLFRIRNRRDTQ